MKVYYLHIHNFSQRLTKRVLILSSGQHVYIVYTFILNIKHFLFLILPFSEDNDDEDDPNHSETSTTMDPDKFWSRVVGGMCATETLINIAFSPPFQKLISDKSTPKRRSFQMIADKLRDLGFDLPWKSPVACAEKVHQKYRNLIMIHKRYLDKAQKTGAAPVKIPKFHELVHPYLSKRHDVLPRGILDSFSSPPPPSPRSSPIESFSFSSPSPQSPSPVSPLSLSFPPLSSSSLSPCSSTYSPPPTPSTHEPKSLFVASPSPSPSPPSSLPPACSTSSSSSSRYHHIKKSVRPKKEEVSHLLMQFNKEEADRRERELKVYEEAKKKEQNSDKSFLICSKECLIL